MQETLRLLVPIVMAHALVLVAIVIIIKRLFVNDAMNAVNRVKQVEAEIRKKEEGIRLQIQEHEKEFLRKKEEREKEIERERDESKKQMDRLREQMLADARADGDRIIQQAKKSEDRLREKIEQDMEEKAVDYGAQLFNLVFSENITEELNRQFMNELLDALDQIDSSTIAVDSTDAEFTLSHPMDPKQKERLEKLLTEKFGADIRVNEKVEEDLLAGMIFKLGSLEIDGSLLNRCREAAAEMKRTRKA